MISEREGPTSSPQTNLLIQLCLETIETGQPSLQLRSVLETRESGLEVARQNFMGKVQEQDEQQAQILQPEIDEVQSCFDSYHETLGSVRRYLETHQIGDLQHAIAGLTQVTPRLGSALDAYEARFMVVGPSEYPIVNIWTKVLDAVRSHTMATSDLQAMMEGAREFFGRCLQELDTYPEEDTSHSAVTYLREGYRLFLSAIDEIDTYTRDGREEHLDVAMEGITSSHARMQQGVDAYRDAKVTGKAATMVINAANLVLKGEMFGTGLDSLDGFFGALKSQIEGLPIPPFNMPGQTRREEHQ